MNPARPPCILCGPPKRVIILLPVLNERQNIAELLDRIEAVLAQTPHTVCIVDDGSADGTTAYVEERIARTRESIHLIRRQKTIRGSQRGSALHVSLLWSLANTTGDVFVEIDGDLSHRPEELPEGIGFISRGESDVAIASKYLAGSKVTNRPWGRLMVSRVSSFAVGLVLTRRIRDYSNGYRFYSRAAAEIIAGHQIVYASPIYLSEVLALWLNKKLRIREFPTTYIGRNEGVSKLRFVDLFKAVLAIFEVSFRFHTSGFRPVRKVGTTPAGTSQECSPPAVN